MAKTAVSDEEIQLRKRARRRLVGAVALVLLAVVFLPMVLDSEPKQRPQEISIQIPPIPAQTPAPAAGQTGTSVPPAPEASLSARSPASRLAEKAGAPANPAPSSPTPSSERAGQSVLAPKAVAPSRPAPSPKAAPTANQPPAVVTQAGSAQGQPGEGYVIRLGAFSDANNAKQLLAKLKANKIAGYSEAINTPQGHRVRVRAGPFPTEQSAQSARDRLRELKLIPAPSEGKIVRQGE